MDLNLNVLAIMFLLISLAEFSSHRTTPPPRPTRVLCEAIAYGAGAVQALFLQSWWPLAIAAVVIIGADLVLKRSRRQAR